MKQLGPRPDQTGQGRVRAKLRPCCSMPGRSSQEAVLSEYTADNIKVLKGLEGVRKRPAMYVQGGTGVDGYHQLLTEIIDNAIDESLAGRSEEHTSELQSRGHLVCRLLLAKK